MRVVVLSLIPMLAAACHRNEGPVRAPLEAVVARSGGPSASALAPGVARDPDTGPDTGPDTHPDTQPDTHVLDKFRQPDRLIGALGLRAGDVVAEVGAGSGYLSPRLARAVGPTGRVVATDIDATLLTTLEARARAGSFTQISTRLVPPGDPRLEPAHYDLIFLAQVDHLLPDRAAYLRALLAALKPGGRIAISNRDRWKQGLLDAVKLLPLSLSEEQLGLPAQFLVFLAAAPAARVVP